MHRLKCYIGWQEKVAEPDRGFDGVARVLIVPLDDEMKELIEEKMADLEKLLRLTTFSEETIVFKIEELEGDGVCPHCGKELVEDVDE